jgi:hypothetical protein
VQWLAVLLDDSERVLAVLRFEDGVAPVSQDLGDEIADVSGSSSTRRMLSRPRDSAASRPFMETASVASSPGDSPIVTLVPTPGALVIPTCATRSVD